MNQGIVLVGKKADIIKEMGELIKLVSVFMSENSEGGEELTVSELVKLAELTENVKCKIMRLDGSVRNILADQKRRELNNV